MSADTTREPFLVAHRLASLVALAFSAASAVDYYGPSPRFCEAGGGCELVHDSEIGQTIGVFLPGLGLAVYTALLALSLAPRGRWRRAGLWLGLLGAQGAAAFLVVQGAVIGAWCWLCVGVDSAAIVAGVAVVLAGRFGELNRPPEATETRAKPWWRSAWWAAWVVAVAAPIAWGLTAPGSPIPEVVRARYVNGAVNVVILSDPECPFCRRLHPVLDAAIEASAADGAPHHVERVLVPLSFHLLAREAARAIYCAEDAGQGDAMRERVYTDDDLSRRALFTHAAALGLPGDAFARCMDAAETDARVEAGVDFARAAGMRGLPTVFIGERTILGFDPGAGAAPYEEALAAARVEGGPTRPVWPFAAIALVAVALALTSRPRTKG